MRSSSLFLGALSLLFGCAVACRDEAPAGDPVRGAGTADTVIVRDSLGRELEVVVGRQAGAIEVDLRAGSGRPDAPGVVDGISPERAAELMRAATPPWFIIDVRDSELYVRQGWIEGAMLFELPRIRDNIGDLHVRTDQTVVVYDDDGTHGEEAARLFASYGLPVVRYIEGGYQAWVAEGLPVKTY